MAFGAVGAFRAPATLAQEATEYLGPHFPYSRFDALPHSTIETDGGKIEIAFAPERMGQQKSAVFEWVRQSAKAIMTYMGRFPVPRLRLLIVPVPGAEIHGTTWGYEGAAIRITLGQDTPDNDVVRNWVLTHELVHVASPSLQDEHEHLWLEEGLSTYIQPIARAQAGLVSPAYVWRQFLWGMPQGLPQPGDQGLDHTHSWGRTFWGGALFCLLADLRIRMRTDNRQSLQTAMRAIAAAGGNVEVRWPIARVLEITDRATAVPALTTLYETMKDKPYNVDLARLWSRLGVTQASPEIGFESGTISLDDRAPLAAIRRAITTRPPAHPVPG
ncbi:MAG: hypothetical protein ACREHV_17750 [Rhizomicrobium sp.]